ncbi:unnamed protein product, partial [Nesidiocoris tenuis]
LFTSRKRLAGTSAFLSSWRSAGHQRLSKAPEISTHISITYFFGDAAAPLIFRRASVVPFPLTKPYCSGSSVTCFSRRPPYQLLQPLSFYVQELYYAVRRRLMYRLLVPLVQHYCSSLLPGFREVPNFQTCIV